MGSLVYCRVESADRDLPPLLSCKANIAGTGDRVAKDWMTGEAEFCRLEGGHAFQVSLSLASSLLKSESDSERDNKRWKTEKQNGFNNVLGLLGQSFPFEVAIGANG